MEEPEVDDEKDTAGSIVAAAIADTVVAAVESNRATVPESGKAGIRETGGPCWFRVRIN